MLVTDPALTAVEEQAEHDLVGDIRPKGFSRSVRVHNIRALQPSEVMT